MVQAAHSVYLPYTVKQIIPIPPTYMKRESRSTIRTVGGFELECWGGPDDGRLQWLPGEGSAVWVYPPDAPDPRLFGAADGPPRQGALGRYRVARAGRGHPYLRWHVCR
jgi:hypothetical protein